ncbi:MAG: hypothetical protein ACTHWW_11425 [Arthrobacter sp.]|uniref:hypothetical protein n=1 Tax=unclassified Arthrobacter TaxID=235627 RepID=UPI002653F7C1|nr:hypothetical protein [Micrococcaceae bacterium]MDN5824795.1 hypothetical protein [Micrococcaceae bacterium]MDN5880305.1 hypothetical protein [Micrococcaceae bacterium]MDN5887714.1 hypothetical protein [Micrococcaceae bacterium]MDN5904965.1 hypothetical protein [Micrococcaceae bacterium]
MNFILTLLIFVHILGAAAIFGGWLASFKTPTVGLWQWIGAITQVVTGILMFGLLEMGDGEPNRIKLGVKLIIALGVLVAAWIGRKKVKNHEVVPTGIAHGVGGLALINIAIAVLWV